MLAPLLLALLPAPFFAGDILTLDDDPGAQFNDLASVLEAAQTGDTILVGAGTYGAAPGVEKLTIAGKGISIVSSSGGSPIQPKFTVGLEIKDLPLGERFSMRFISVENTAEAVQVKDCVGTVWLEEVSLRSDLQSSTPLMHSRLTVESSRNVVLIESYCAPSSEEHPEADVPAVLDALNSRVFVYDCAMWGGTALSATGRPAVRVRNSQVVTHGGGIHGGAVFPVENEPCPESGGVAIELDGGGAQLTSYGTELVGGLMFPSFGCSAVPGPVLTGTGTLTEVNVPVFRDLTIGRLLTSGTAHSLKAEGLPGEAISIAVFQAHGGLELPAALGSLFAPVTATPLISGEIGSGGTFTAQFTPAELPAGTALPFYAQAVLVGLYGPRLSRPTHSVLQASL